MRRTPAATQESYVSQGLALGVLANEVAHVVAGKVEFDLAFSRAWRSFPHRTEFPAVANPNRADPYYALLFLGQRRNGLLLAGWSRIDQVWKPYVWNHGWSVEESGETLARWTQVRWGDWQDLGREFLVDLAADLRQR